MCLLRVRLIKIPHPKPHLALDCPKAEVKAQPGARLCSRMLQELGLGELSPAEPSQLQWEKMEVQQPRSDAQPLPKSLSL